jgi:hypothetical protein
VQTNYDGTVGYTKSVEFEAEPRTRPSAKEGPVRSAAVVMAALLYSLVRVLLDVITTSRSNEAQVEGQGAGVAPAGSSA